MWCIIAKLPIFQVKFCDCKWLKDLEKIKQFWIECFVIGSIIVIKLQHGVLTLPIIKRSVIEILLFRRCQIHIFWDMGTNILFLNWAICIYRLYYRKIILLRNVDFDCKARILAGNRPVYADLWKKSKQPKIKERQTWILILAYATTREVLLRWNKIFMYQQTV